MNENSEMHIEEYIPEYNPTKYLKAIKISKIVSLICLIIMIIGVAFILLKANLDNSSFIVNVNGVPQKNWSWIIILIGIVVAVFGLTSLFTYVLNIRLKQANAVFAEPDEQKRLEKHLKFDKQAKVARRIWAASAAANIANDKK